MASVSDFTLLPQDRRDAGPHLMFDLTVSNEALVRVESAGMREYRPHGRRALVGLPAAEVSALRASLWPITIHGKFGGDPPSGLSVGDPRTGWNAGSLLRLIDALPVVVLPERRDFTVPPSLRLPDAPKGIAENLVTADHLLPRFVHLACAAPDNLAAIEALAGNLLGAKLQTRGIPADEELHVSVGGDPFRRIQDLGGGVTEVLVLALTLTEYDGGLLLYEEPELHLHPAVQRRMLDHLASEAVRGTWQVLLTTHSEHFLAAWKQDGVRCVEVTRANGVSEMQATDGREALRRTIERLGPSSVLAARTVIWVEGPSDAIYLRYFLQHHSPTLVEYEDFAFAFFGGALLTHTRLSDMPVADLVDLFAVHPKSYVVFDSDRSAAGAALGKGYAQQFVGTALVDRVWVTAGREIENYLPDSILTWAARDDCDATVPSSIDRDFAVFHEQVKAVRDDADRARAARDTSDDAKARFAIDAVKLMKEKAIIPTAFDPLARLDLRLQLERLARFIDPPGGAA